MLNIENIEEIKEEDIKFTEEFNEEVFKAMSSKQRELMKQLHKSQDTINELNDEIRCLISIIWQLCDNGPHTIKDMDDTKVDYTWLAAKKLPNGDAIIRRAKKHPGLHIPSFVNNRNNLISIRRKA